MSAPGAACGKRPGLTAFSLRLRAVSIDFDAVAQASCKLRVKHLASGGGTACTVKTFYKKVDIGANKAGYLADLSANNRNVRLGDGFSRT